jgi:hypothetical protein
LTAARKILFWSNSIFLSSNLERLLVSRLGVGVNKVPSGGMLVEKDVISQVDLLNKLRDLGSLTEEELEEFELKKTGFQISNFDSH